MITKIADMVLEMVTLDERRDPELRGKALEIADRIIIEMDIGKIICKKLWRLQIWMCDRSTLL